MLWLIAFLRLVRCSECEYVYTRPRPYFIHRTHLVAGENCLPPIILWLPDHGHYDRCMQNDTHSQTEFASSLVLGWISAFKSEYSLLHFNQWPKRRKICLLSLHASCYSLAYATKGKVFHIGKQIPRWFLSLWKVDFFSEEIFLKEIRVVKDENLFLN